ncbi:MAG: hypothetical protein ABWZ88_22245 [Variovorax sp.]
MRRSILTTVRHTALVLACVLPLAGVRAQAPAPPPADAVREPLDGRRNQKIENIHIDDGGATVDEVRYGGQTQSISVKPKNAPGYEVLPNNSAQSPQITPDSNNNGNGVRVWNIFKF